MTYPVGIVMGGAQFGPERAFKTGEQLGVLLKVLNKHDIRDIDSAQLYKGSEELLGHINAGTEFNISTKAYGGFQPGSLKSHLLIKEASESLRRLKVEQVDVFYIHAPDASADMVDYLSGIQELYDHGKFRRFGLSNFQSEDVEKVYLHCKAYGYVLPTVFQGNYNVIARRAESTLIPTLRRLNIAFYAYSPIAGGFLTKDREEVLAGAGRFVQGTSAGDMYLDMYARESLLDSLKTWQEVAIKEGISRGEMAYRWIRYHSILKGDCGDKIIIGARTSEAIDETLGWLENGPLSNDCEAAIQKIWDSLQAKGEAPLDNYHR